MLREYVEDGHADAAEVLREWFRTAELAEWSKLADVKASYKSADLEGDRLVFNIKGNKYRLVCRVRFGHPVLYVRWVGTHAEYDRIDVKNI
jgi:mRNA interferase HigB